MSLPSRLLISWESAPEELTQSDLGGKAWNLFRLRRFGFPVPPWFVLTTGVFDSVLDPHRDAIEELLRTADLRAQAGIEGASRQIADILLGRRHDGFLSQALAPVGERFGEDALVSVRSSVVGEDSEKNSFAGQMDSFLNVPAGGIVEAVKKVWASAFSPRALAYRLRRGLSLTDVSTAVVVQKMVQARASGVLFTREPGDGSRRCVIAAGLGLGEGVVADLVASDTYRIAWDSDEVSTDLAEKDYRVALDAARGAGTCKEPVPAELKAQPVLSHGEIHRLRALGREAESRFGAPQDIEWAIDERGELFVLQARPLTSTKERAESAQRRIWDNSNIIESYPGLTLPLTFTFVRHGYEANFRRFAFKRTLASLPFKNPVKERSHIFSNMIGLLDGRVYYNLLHWYEMLSFLPGFNGVKEAWDRMIGIGERIDFPKTGFSSLNRLCAWSVAIGKLLAVRRTAKRFFAFFNPVYDDVKALDLSRFAEHELTAVYETLAQKLIPIWYLTLDNDVCAMRYYSWLKALCDRWKLSAHPNLHNDLLCGQSDVASVAPVRSLIRLAAMFRADAGYASLLAEEEDDGVVWKRIQRDPGYEPLKAALRAYLEDFGDRSPEELKLESPTFRERPELLLGVIRNALRQNLSAEVMQQREEKIRRDAERFARNHLRNPLRRLLFRFVLRNARLAVANRENMRFARSRLFGVVRRLFQEMGRLFAQRGLLDSSADIHYLTVEEVFGFVCGTAASRNLKALVEIRRAEYAGYARRAPAGRFETTGIPYLNLPAAAGTAQASGDKATGIGCSSGVARGKARVVLNPHCNLNGDDHILVTHSTDPGWVFLMISSKGIVVEKGSVLSHTAIIGRELGIPTIIGVKDATTLIPDGAALSIDGGTGELQWQSDSSPSTLA